jgi:hypothetical protein
MKMGAKLLTIDIKCPLGVVGVGPRKTDNKFKPIRNKKYLLYSLPDQ